MASITGQADNQAVNQYEGLLRSVGSRALNAQFPNDFEFYTIGLELVDSDEKTVEYMIFPIMPSSISETLNPITNIKKTAGGVTVLSTSTFVPTDISLSGNFGRKFKFLVGQDILSFSSLSLKKKSNNNGTSEFSSKVKTGYGCLKLLERIILKSNELDSKQKPHALYLYNLALGNNYLVKCTSFNPHQDQGSNMIWNYSVQFKSLTRAENIERKNSKSLTKSLSFSDGIQKLINHQVSNLGSILKNTTGLNFNI